jgi:hypothetical protein
VALAAIASFHHDLAIDEPFTALAIARPSALGTTLVHDSLPLYYLLLLGWTRVFGQSAAALRAMSMIAFGGAILFSAGAARRIAGSRAGALAGAFVACSVTFGLQPAATVRPYALVMMFAAMALWAAFREARLPLFAAHLLGLVTHPIFVFFSLASAAAGAVCGRKRRLLAITPLAALAIYAATWGVMLARTAALPATSWMARPEWADVVSGLLFWGDHATPILLAVVAMLFAVRGTRAVREYATPLAFLVVLAGMALAETIVVSMMRPVYLASRTPVIVLPAAAVACGVVVAALAPLLVTCAMAALVSVSAVRFTVRSATRPDPYPTRASVGAIAPRLRCGDTIVAAGLAYAPILYYAPAAGVPSCVTVRAFPEDVEEHPGWLDVTSSERSALARQAEVTVSSLGRTGTLWAFVRTRGVGADAGAALVNAASRARPWRESIIGSGSFFDEVIAFYSAGNGPARP